MSERPSSTKRLTLFGLAVLFAAWAVVETSRYPPSVSSAPRAMRTPRRLRSRFAVAAPSRLSPVLTRSPESGHPEKGQPTTWRRAPPASSYAARTSAAPSRGRRHRRSTRSTICGTTRQAPGFARACRSTRLRPSWATIRAPCRRSTRTFSERRRTSRRCID